MITHPVLGQLATQGVKLGLDRVRSFLHYLGEPHRAYPVVHVAGTNGKGSVCAMLTQVLVDAGYRVGTCTSPHLEAVNERVAIDGRSIDDFSLREAIERLDRDRWEWARAQRFEQVPLTYFEFMTVLAFQHFADQRVDVAVVEVGLGGRLDATNVVRPIATAITSVGLDHIEELGSTLTEIATEKAGILEAGVPVTLGPMAEEAWTAIEHRAAQLAAPLWRPGPHIAREQRGGLWSYRTPAGSISDLKLSLAGEHQGANAAVAVGVLHQLRQQGFLVPDEAIRSGLASAFVPGRLETLLPGLVIDGAHNLPGTEALAAWLARQPRPDYRILLWGMGQGREPGRIIAPLLPHVDEVVTTRCAHPKAHDPLELAMMLEDHVDVDLSAGGPVEQALPEVYAEANETLVAGSLYLVGAVRALVGGGALEGIEPGQGPPSVDGDVVEHEESDDDGSDDL